METESGGATLASESPQATGLRAGLRRWRRLVPVDLVALLVIAIAVVASHLRYIRQGECFNDASWYFHFGHRLNQGDVPYRDYVFQVGPLPIYMDALFQRLFGLKYIASLYAALMVTILRVWVMWMITRRLTDWRAATLVAIYCMFDLSFAFVYHWSTPYAHLFIALSGLFFVMAFRARASVALAYLGLAGFSAALVVSARQSSAVVIAFVLFVTSVILAIRKAYFTRARLVALWGGFAAGLLVMVVVLALQGALGAAVQQMFLDAPQKKGVTGIDSILDALTGGALVLFRYYPDFTWWGGLLLYIGLPAVVVAVVLYLAARDERISTASIAPLLVPGVMVYGLITRYAILDWSSDLPRTLLSATTVLAVLAPRRLRDWLGLEPHMAIALGALPLASDWALEMSNRGRGWGDSPSLIAGVLLLTMAMRFAIRPKLVLVGLFAFAGLLHTAAQLRRHENPFGNDGALVLTKHRVAHPMLRGMRFSEGRARMFTWLASQVPSGSTCFIYGNVPVLYTLLNCKNPTRIDTTAADFPTIEDVDLAIAALRAHPPDYILGHERAWMNPPLSVDLPDTEASYASMNTRVSRGFHIGLRSMLDDYESVGKLADVVGPALAAQTADKWDAFDQIRVYRRKR